MAYNDDFLAQLQRGIGKPFLNPQPNALLPPAPAAAAAPATPTPVQQVFWVPHDSAGAVPAPGGPAPTGIAAPLANGVQTSTLMMPGMTNSLANMGTTPAQPAAPAAGPVGGSIYGYQGNDATR